MPLLAAFIGISAIAAYLLRHTWLFIPALINAITNFWSLGILWNYRGAQVSGNYETIVATVSILTSAVGIILLFVSFFVH
jgi:hypothetical protein